MLDDSLIITEKDYLRLQHLMKSLRGDLRENLEIELERAKIISDFNVPRNLVTMNSRIRFRVAPENLERVATLSYPEIQGEDRVSILAPEGCALLGLREGQHINWMFPDGKTRTIEVLEIIYQPEASGHWQL